MILFLLSIGKWIKDQQKKATPEAVKPVATKKASAIKLKKEVKLAPVTADLRLKGICPLFENFNEDDIKYKEVTADNTHFKKDGEIFRLRIFIEDGANGSYKKLVLYKEDETGFPRIIKQPDEKTVNPSPEVISSYLKDAEIIHQESDYRYELKDDRTISFTQINGEIVKVNSEEDDCFYEKETP